MKEKLIKIFKILIKQIFIPLFIVYIIFSMIGFIGPKSDINRTFEILINNNSEKTITLIDNNKKININIGGQFLLNKKHLPWKIEIIKDNEVFYTEKDVLSEKNQKIVIDREYYFFPLFWFEDEYIFKVRLEVK